MNTIWLDYNVDTNLYELKVRCKVVMTFKMEDYFKGVKVAQRLHNGNITR